MLRTNKTPWAIAGVGLIGLTFAACRPGTPASSTAQVRPEYDKATGQLTRLEYDSDGDGKIDTWGYMDGSRVVRVEVDEDGDGKVDRWEFHKDSRQAPVAASSPINGRPSPAAGVRPSAISDLRAPVASADKTIERIERATRHDGKVTRWEFFENGLLTRVEEDTNGDGKVDKWETYTDGTLAMMALDTKGLGKPDRRLIYRADGNLDRIEADLTGSGEFRPLPQAAP